ncbi:MAG TPA: hypothetical protein VIJ66_03380 [Solirubrobacteraceae bacterium]
MNFGRGRDTSERGPGTGAFPPPGHGAGPQRDLQTDPSAAERQAERDQEREPESEVGRIMRESQEQRDRQQEQDRDLGYGIE